MELCSNPRLWNFKFSVLITCLLLGIKLRTPLPRGSSLCEGIGEGCCTQPYPCICKEAVSGFEPMTNKSPRHNFTAAPGLALMFIIRHKSRFFFFSIWAPVHSKHKVEISETHHARVNKHKEAPLIDHLQYKREHA